MAALASSFTVTFAQAGEFDYICALHDYMGMMGTVEVRR
ncbi:plastocyanin/azurin family copper-binding protein [Arthrobacter sp. H-02-3]|nr:plastocyanin/azurin family copper-binding protein [Arthrobacter sp. H-02-3]